MCKHDSARPALHPKQCAAKMVPSHSVITQTFTSGSFILWEWCTFPTTTCFPAIILSCTEVTNPLKCLQACMAFKLLLGVVTSFQNKSVASSIDGKHSGLNWSLGILAGSTTTSEIFCKYLLLTCVSKTFAYSESTGISFEDYPGPHCSFPVKYPWSNRKLLRDSCELAWNLHQITLPRGSTMADTQIMHTAWRHVKTENNFNNLKLLRQIFYVDDIPINCAIKSASVEFHRTGYFHYFGRFCTLAAFF